jgi:hypothetical protein
MKKVFEEEPEACEICGDAGELVDCEGVLCCETCAKEHGMKLAEFRDEMNDDLRNS